MPFTLPGAEDRTVVIGPTGSGKTVAAAWLLSRQNFNVRPWVAFNYKDEILWDQVGDPPMRPLRVGEMPGKRGLYNLHVRPDEAEEVEAWLWRIWEKGNIGLFCDEASLLPRKEAFKAILRQGRSKRIPVIACTQRPVGCEREIFSESQYSMFFGLRDARDWEVVRELMGGHEKRLKEKLPRHWSYWYDAKQDTLTTLRPVPSPDRIAADLRQTVPYGWFLGG